MVSQGLIRRRAVSVAQVRFRRALSTFVVAGIETSCDDTGVGLVRSDGRVLSNVVASQMKIHSKYGGIVPRLAARAHKENLPQVASEALKQAELDWSQVDLLCVTTGPGLAPCLRTGVEFAAKVSSEHQIPLVSMNHLVGHVLMSRMNPETRCEFPFLSLVVSGGHSLLVQADSPDAYTLLGTTQDDAMGEAFDKVARMLGIDKDTSMHPGQALEQLAQHGDASKCKLPVPLRRNVGQPDFSFSGLKSAVSRFVGEVDGRTLHKADIAAGFQTASVEHVLNSVRRALVFSGTQIDANAELSNRLSRQISKDVVRMENVKLVNQLSPPKGLVVSGGVACNKFLRAELEKLCSLFSVPVYFPPPNLCTDNGVMIAWAGCELIAAGILEPPHTALPQKTSLQELNDLVNPRWRIYETKDSFSCLML